MRKEKRLSIERIGVRQFNLRLIFRLVGVLMLYLCVGMVLPIAVSLYSRDGAQFALVLSTVGILTAGLFFRNILGKNPTYDLKENESYWVTTVTWLSVPLIGALPYIFTGAVNNFTDAVFESFSGFTTTGSSVLAHPEELPKGLLVYRAFTQWVGGLGLMLFVVAILRRLTLGAEQIYEAEFSGTQQRKLHPRLAKSVTRMWAIYSLLTLAMIVLLIISGTPVVDAICLAFSTVSTGGFVTNSAGLSILPHGTLIIVTIFMLLSGINVARLYRLFTLKLKHWSRDEELRTYLVIFIVSVAACTLSFISAGEGSRSALCYSVVHIASTISTCGFYMARPEHWSFLVSVITFLIIIVGASAGSTSGGIKLRRIIILFKYIRNYFTRMMHPNAVFRVKINNEVVQPDYINKVFAYVFLYIAFILGGAFVLTLCRCSIPDAICMAAANISNLGPSPLINNLGGSLDYALLPSVGKWALTILMLAGRLELFALIAVFSPAYWRRGT